MSTNLHIKGTRTIRVLKTGKIEEQHIFANVYQTPTDITYQILNSKNKLEEYEKWVMSVSEDYEENIYANYHDEMLERNPIGTETINYGKEHINALKKWIHEAEENGYEIEYYAM